MSADFKTAQNKRARTRKKPRASTEKARASGRVLLGSSEGGEGSPNARVPQPLRGSDTLASTTLDHIPSLTNPVPPSPVASPGPSLPLPDSEDVPGLNQPIVVSPIVKSPVQLNAYRAPSVKNAGKDADGNVIPHHRSEEIAALVQTYVGMGASINYMCVMLNIRPGQLKACYANELEHGVEHADLEVVSAAHSMATSQEDPAMTQFWLKHRKKWNGKESNEDGNIFDIHIHM